LVKMAHFLAATITRFKRARLLCLRPYQALIGVKAQKMRQSNENVREAIRAAFNNITPNMVRRATQQIVRRAELCLEARGKHFE